jgi:hypothetical protein
VKHGNTIRIRRGRKHGVLEVRAGQDGGLWVCTIRGRKGRRKGSFVLERAEAILLADMLAEAAPPLQIYHRDD